jgi:hypothetical protein
MKLSESCTWPKSYLLRGAMTGFIAYVFFLYPSRVSSQEAFDVLSPDDGKLSRPVLRGPGLTMGSGYSINRLHPVRT